MKGNPLIFLNYSIKNQANNTADIFIDGEIVDAPTQQMLKSWLGDDTSVSYKSFRDMVSNSEAGTFNVYINSGGGQVTEAMAIHDLLIDLQAKGKTVNTYGRGIIASAATYILMAGENSEMSANSWLMIHNVSGMVFGDVNEVENMAATMRRFNDASVNFYQKATGISRTVIGNMMDVETWMTAEDAKQKGFIKNVSGEVKFSQTIKPESWPFSNSSVLNLYNSYVKKSILNISDSEKSYLNQMIPLLQRSIDLSKTALQSTVTPYVQSLAGSIIDEQTENIEEMQEQLDGTEESNENKNRSKILNSSKHKNFMDTTKITASIETGFANLLAKLGISNKSDEAATKTAFAEFTANITNALKAGEPTDEALKLLVSNAISEAFKTVPESFTNAISEATKGFVKSEDIKDLVKADAIKNLLSKSDFEVQMKTLTDALIQKISGGKVVNTETKANPKNKIDKRWSYENLWPADGATN